MKNLVEENYKSF